MEYPRTRSRRTKRRVQFSNGALRPVNIQERKTSSQGVIQHTGSYQRSLYAPKLKDRSEEETLKQERCSRGDVWEMEKLILKLKEKDKATFFSPSNVPAPSLTKLQESLCSS